MKNMISKIAVVVMSAVIFSACEPIQDEAGLNGKADQVMLKMSLGTLPQDVSYLDGNLSRPINGSDALESLTFGFTMGVNNEATAELNDIEAGTWTLTVTARNANGTALYIGSTPVEISAGSTNQIELELNPIASTGGLDVKVRWTQSLMPDSLDLQWVPQSGLDGDWNIKLDWNYLDLVGSVMQINPKASIYVYIDRYFFNGDMVSSVQSDEYWGSNYINKTWSGGLAGVNADVLRVSNYSDALSYIEITIPNANGQTTTYTASVVHVWKKNENGDWILEPKTMGKLSLGNVLSRREKNTSHK